MNNDEQILGNLVNKLEEKKKRMNASMKRMKKKIKKFRNDIFEAKNVPDEELKDYYDDDNEDIKHLKEVRDLDIQNLTEEKNELKAAMKKEQSRIESCSLLIEWNTDIYGLLKKYF